MGEFINASIMIGAVDETDSLRDTVLGVLKLCDHKDIKEIIIAYSQHITPECKAVVDELAALKEDVPIIVFMQKTYRLGAVAEALEKVRGSHCIFCASDSALDIECLPEMINKVKENGDRIATTSRWLPGCKFYGYNKVKKLLNYFGQIFLRILFRTKMTDMTNPFQLVPSEVYQSIKWESCEFPIVIEMILKPLRLGYGFIEVPTNCYPRKQGKSKNSFKQTAMYLKTALHIRFMKKKDILKKDSVLYKKYYG